MTTQGWGRGVHVSSDWTVGFTLLAQLPPGGTYLRVHFGWGFEGTTPLTGTMLGVMQNLQVFGLCTTVGDGGGPPPDPRTHPTDVDAPSQRWLWWEARAPRVRSVDSGAELVTWTDSGPQERVDTKAMVSGATVPAGQFLNLWASWAAAYDWPVDGQVIMWHWASFLGRVAG